MRSQHIIYPSLVCLAGFASFGCGGMKSSSPSPATPVAMVPVSDSTDSTVSNTVNTEQTTQTTQTTNPSDFAQAQPPSEFSEAYEATRAISSRKGFQLVLLSNWQSGSATKFADAVKEYRSGIEFTFAPYIYAPSQNRYANANTILTSLKNAGRNVSVCVYLSFQKSGSGADKEIENNAADFNANFLRTWANRGVTIAVCPGLEDTGSNADVSRWANKVWAKLDTNLRGKVVLRRSPHGDNREKGLPSKGGFAAVELELHGKITGSAQNYSNDGNFVYSTSNNERPESMGGHNPSPQYELATFKSSTEANRNTTALLWRPLYNVFTRTTRKDASNKTYVFFDKDNRKFNNTAPGFDDNERTAARRFLGL